MKVIRKTNLFNEYKSATSPDTTRKSFFLPLSNYAESLTGNHLSVNAKLFPSAFICVYIKDYDSAATTSQYLKSIDGFIKKMAQYYENKMAFLRDCAASSDKDMSFSGIESLPYFLHYMQRGQDSFQITYVGEIAEQDYDGVYSDMMLTIEPGMSPRKYTLYCIDTTPNIGAWTGKKTIDYPFYEAQQTNYLYGWYYKDNDSTNVYTGPELYRAITPGLDIGGTPSSPSHQYITNVSEYFTGVSCVYDANPGDTIKFNFVVPLYDVFIDDPTKQDSGTQRASWIDNTVPTSAGETIKTIDFNYIKTVTGRSLYDTLVPYGIWCSGYTPVTLNRKNGENPAWTLTLSQQFKPFPYSAKLDANDSRANLWYGNDGEYKTPFHDTFAQVLARQNNAIDKIMEQDKAIASLRNEINTLKSLIQQK